MTYRDAGYWHGKSKFVKEKASELLVTIVRSDNHGSRNLSFRAQNDLKALSVTVTYLTDKQEVLDKAMKEKKRNPNLDLH